MSKYNVKFRPRQRQAVRTIRNEFRNGFRRLLMVGPPGSGKGTIMGGTIALACEKGRTSLLFVHKRDLIYQLADRWSEQFGIDDVGFILSGEPQLDRQVMLGSVQTMIRRPMIDTDYLLGDEIHRLKTNTHSKIVDYYKNKDIHFTGWTATPFRSDKKGFKDDFDKLIHFAKYSELVQDKYLVPTKIIAPKVSPDLDGIHTRSGDYVDGELFEVYNEERIYRGVVEKYKEYASGMKTIVFNVNSKEHSRKTAEWFRKYGYKAEAIDSDTPNKVREQLLEDFRNDKFDVLCNIGLFTEGISIDDVKCIVFNVATKSKQKWVQAAARGSRPVWNSDYSDWKKNGKYYKTECLILDFGGNGERHGYVDDYDLAGFDLSGTPLKMSEEAATKACPECDHLCYVQTKICPECGFQFPVELKGDKIFSDEVGWQIVSRAKQVSKELLNISYRSAQELDPGLLRIVGKVKGYKANWAIHLAIRRGIVQNKNARNPVHIAQVTEYLKRCEESAGYAHIYDIIDRVYG